MSGAPFLLFNFFFPDFPYVDRLVSNSQGAFSLRLPIAGMCRFESYCQASFLVVFFHICKQRRWKFQSIFAMKMDSNLEQYLRNLKGSGFHPISCVVTYMEEIPTITSYKQQKVDTIQGVLSPNECSQCLCCAVSPYSTSNESFQNMILLSKIRMVSSVLASERAFSKRRNHKKWSLAKYYDKYGFKQCFLNLFVVVVGSNG